MALESCKHTHVFDRTRKEIVEHGSTMFPIACYLKDWNKECIPWHWHEEMEYMSVIKGNITVGVGVEKTVLHEGDAYFANTGVLHGCWNESEEGCTSHSLVYHPRLMGGSLDSVFWQKYLQPLMQEGALPCYFFRRDNEWDQKVMAYAERAWEECAREHPGYEWEVRYNLSCFSYSLLGKCKLRQDRQSGKHLRDSVRIKAMLQYIQNHYMEEVTSEQVAASASISESEALRCFRATIGTTPIQYVKEFRMQKAVDLLENTDLKVQEIGEQCGFQDMSYFARTFRNVYGCAPSEYRGGKDRE